MGRVVHSDPGCRVCRRSTPGLSRTAAPIPPPFPNPEYKPGKKGLPRGGPDQPGFSEGGQHGQHWYHGTTFSPQEQDENDHPDSRESGGRLLPPQVDEHSGSNEREGVHWNTDLGVHFTSLSGVARSQFTNKRDIDARVAHATLHMTNPKHYPDEVAFGRHAIDWAHANGHKALSHHQADHDDFVHGEFRKLTKGDTEGRDYGHFATEPIGRSERRDISELDRKGTKSPVARNLHSVDQYLALHPKRHQITSGFREHLESQGHDGVVYGNDYEGPSGHTSAIAFPSTPIGIHHWEWQHPKAQGMPKTPQEARERRSRGEIDDEDQMKLFGALVTAGAQELKFKLWQSPKTKQHPDKLGTHTLTAVHPKKGPVGTLQYIKRADHLQVELLSVPRIHRGNGYAGHLMDEMQRRHPATPINHGERTDDGQDWWDSYTRDKQVTKGRTIASLDGGQQRALDRLGQLPEDMIQGEHLHKLLAEHNVHLHEEDPWEAGEVDDDHMTGDTGRSRHHAPDVPLHTAQNNLWRPTLEHFIRNPGASGDAERPSTWTHGDQHWINGGHHRIIADRMAQKQGTTVSDRTKTASVHTASGWTSEHFNLEGNHWRGIGGPSDDPRKHMVHYDVHGSGQVTFPDRFGSGTDLDRIRSRHGDDDAARMRGQVLDHHGATEHDPNSEPPPPSAPEKVKRRTYYHGTTVPDVTHILPANHHGQGVVFQHVTDKDYAYASEDPKDAWTYAEKAYDTVGNGPKGDRHPRVYQVRPIGGHQHVEEDPAYNEHGSRNVNLSDRRSKKGWEVVREMKMPKHMGKPEDWHEGGERA